MTSGFLHSTFCNYFNFLWQGNLFFFAKIFHYNTYIYVRRLKVWKENKKKKSSRARDTCIIMEFCFSINFIYLSIRSDTLSATELFTPLKEEKKVPLHHEVFNKKVYQTRARHQPPQMDLLSHLVSYESSLRNNKRAKKYIYI